LDKPGFLSVFGGLKLSGWVGAIVAALFIVGLLFAYGPGLVELVDRFNIQRDKTVRELQEDLAAAASRESELRSQLAAAQTNLDSLQAKLSKQPVAAAISDNSSGDLAAARKLVDKMTAERDKALKQAEAATARAQSLATTLQTRDAELAGLQKTVIRTPGSPITSTEELTIRERSSGEFKTPKLEVSVVQTYSSSAAISVNGAASSIKFGASQNFLVQGVSCELKLIGLTYNEAKFRLTC
jgi:uncharacterized phage infection (PIP) family protein YhgE